MSTAPTHVLLVGDPVDGIIVYAIDGSDDPRIEQHFANETWWAVEVKPIPSQPTGPTWNIDLDVEVSASVTIAAPSEAQARALFEQGAGVDDITYDWGRADMRILSVESDDPPTVPEAGGRISEYQTDTGEWVRCTVLTENAAGLHSIELHGLPGLRDYAYDVSPDRIRWTT